MSSHHRTLSRRALLALIFIVGYAFSEPGRPGAAQQAPQGAGAAALPPGVERVTSVEGITEYRLANGLKVLLFPDPTKQTITVNITYLVGSRARELRRNGHGAPAGAPRVQGDAEASQHRAGADRTRLAPERHDVDRSHELFRDLCRHRRQSANGRSTSKPIAW